MTNRGQLQTVCDSGSLWNFTCSPGWNDEDVRVLRVAIMKYGCGNWKKIARHFPNKTNGQLNLQTQRLFGQQSTAEFFMLHVDPNPIRQINLAKKNVLRKNDCVVNTGKRLSKSEKLDMIEENRKKWELPELEYKALEVPIRFDPEPPLNSIHDKIKKLSEVYRTMKSLNAREEEIKTLLKNPSWANEKKQVAEMRNKIRNRLADIRQKSLSQSPKKINGKNKKKKVSIIDDSDIQLVKNKENNHTDNDDNKDHDNDDIDINIDDDNDIDMKNNSESTVTKKQSNKNNRKRPNLNDLDDNWSPKPKMMKKM